MTQLPCNPEQKSLREKHAPHLPFHLCRVDSGISDPAVVGDQPGELAGSGSLGKSQLLLASPTPYRPAATRLSVTLPSCPGSAISSFIKPPKLLKQRDLAEAVSRIPALVVFTTPWQVENKQRGFWS